MIGLLTQDFRKKVLSIRQKEGLTLAEVATRFDIGLVSAPVGVNE